MEVPEHREQVYKALKRALAEDKARTNVLEISELGLVQMTRKRVRQDLRALLIRDVPDLSRQRRREVQRDAGHRDLPGDPGQGGGRGDAAEGARSWSACTPTSSPTSRARAGPTSSGWRPAWR